ncbi:hypothetical protein [Candidatus Rariloculus sp.]|uniref:hypothetical protein n=1 Tax=Candidatus Rariloculus sp. TaxID=3101265 RepID=UPI003D0E38E6
MPIKILPSLVNGTMLRVSCSLGNDVAELNNRGFFLRQKWGVLLQQRHLHFFSQTKAFSWRADPPPSGMQAPFT